jgi:hypothetical protein
MAKATPQRNYYYYYDDDGGGWAAAIAAHAQVADKGEIEVTPRTCSLD